MRCGSNVPATPPAIQSGRASSIPCDIFGQPAQKAPQFSGTPSRRFRGICSDVRLLELKSHSSHHEDCLLRATYPFALCRDVVFKNPPLDVPFSKIAALLPPFSPFAWSTKERRPSSLSRTTFTRNYASNRERRRPKNYGDCEEYSQRKAKNTK